MQKYKVTCLTCGESDILNIDQMNHFVGDTDKKLLTNFMSYRWRPDLRWGYLCKCGNDNRLAPQEADEFDKVVQGDPITVQKIADSLKIPDERQFRMETA